MIARVIAKIITKIIANHKHPLYRPGGTAGVLASAGVVLSRSLWSTGPWLGGLLVSAFVPSEPALAVLAEVQARNGAVVGVPGASREFPPGARGLSGGV
jgi:hypothetical protein